MKETRAGKRTARARGEGRGREISPLRSEYTLYIHTYFIDFLPKKAFQRQHLRKTMRKSGRSVSLATNEDWFDFLAAHVHSKKLGTRCALHYCV